MSSHPVVRTAPIAIAPKPKRSSSTRQNSVSNLDGIGSSTTRSPGSMSASGGGGGGGGAGGADSADSDSNGAQTGGGVSSSGTVRQQHGAAACDSCRRRGIKCIAAEDEDGCISCQVNSVECSLLGSPQPRKRKLNGENAEDGSGKRSSSDQPDSRRRRHHNSSLSSTAASNSLVEDMANFGGPTQLKRTLGLQTDRYSQYIGATTDFEPSLINLSAFDPQDESLLARGTLRKVGDDDVFLMLPDYATPGYEHMTEDVTEIEETVAPHGRRLVDLYFAVVHPGFPIIQKAVFLEKYERDPREFSPPLLAAMYILAINWWDQDPELAPHARPDVARLERLVRTTLADAMYRPKLSTVQAGLLLSQRPEGDQWAPTAQLVAIGQELGLHLDCAHWKIPPWEKGLRKRLAWALYMQDKWGALVHGRPSHVFASNWAVLPLTEFDFPEVDWDERDMAAGVAEERGRLLFTQMVLLTQILADILDTFYTLEAQSSVARAGQDGARHVLTLAKPIQLKLKDWHNALPPAIKMDGGASFGGGGGGLGSGNGNGTPNGTAAGRQNFALFASARFNPIGYLHLAYFATEITLHRRIIRSLADSPDYAGLAAGTSSSSSFQQQQQQASAGQGPGTPLTAEGGSGYGYGSGNGTSGVNSPQLTQYQRTGISGITSQMAPPASFIFPGSGPSSNGAAGGAGSGGAAGGGGGGAADSSIGNALASHPTYVIHICRTAAKARLISAMDLVNRLQPGHLRAFWYFASKTNFALIGTFGSLLWATSPGREEAEWYRRRLGEYRWTLSVSSSSNSGSRHHTTNGGGSPENGGGGGGGTGGRQGLTEFAMGMLDISTGLLKKLPEKPCLSRSGSVSDLDASRRGSLLAMGVGGGGDRNVVGSMPSSMGSGGVPVRFGIGPSSGKPPVSNLSAIVERGAAAGVATISGGVIKGEHDLLEEDEEDDSDDEVMGGDYAFAPTGGLAGMD